VDPETILSAGEGIGKVVLVHVMKAYWGGGGGGG
jgi:hypothetical protein